MQPTIRRRASSAAIVLSLVALVALEPATAERVRAVDRPTPAAKKTFTKKIAPGLTFTRIVQKRIPRRTFVLTVNPAAEISIDPTLAKTVLPSRDKLSHVVKRLGALAGVNGDFYTTAGSPVHPFAQDGELGRTASAPGALFALSPDETTAYFGRPTLSVTLDDLSSDRTFRIDRWNDGPPGPGELVAYSPIGGTLEAPPSHSCSVRLLPTDEPVAAPEDGVNREYTVDAVGCSTVPLSRDGGIVIAASPATDEASQLLAIAPGTTMRLHWTFGWPDVFDAIGGPSMLLEDGTALPCTLDCGAEPRTAVGITASGKILLVVVDGRQSRWSVGPTNSEFVAIMRGLGAVTALNLDGGGSSEMVVKGEVVNHPSDGGERSISNAIVVLPGPAQG